MNTPENFMRCLCADCPRSSECLRWQVGCGERSERHYLTVVNPNHPTAPLTLKPGAETTQQ
ncbi:MAG: hypothetical protein IJ722_05490 [Alloprevotella sp.]|nr:hypothetical protein [Alloprevotella sp.]